MSEKQTFKVQARTDLGKGANRLDDVVELVGFDPIFHIWTPPAPTRRAS